jgi:hypothetical protein
VELAFADLQARMAAGTETAKALVAGQCFPSAVLREAV